MCHTPQVCYSHTMNTLERILTLAERDLDQTVKLLSLTRKLARKLPVPEALVEDLFQQARRDTEAAVEEFLQQANKHTNTGHHSEQDPSPPKCPQFESPVTTLEVSGPDAENLTQAVWLEATPSLWSPSQAETVGPQKSPIVNKVSGPDAGKLGFEKPPAVGDIIPLYMAGDARRLLHHTVEYNYFKNAPASSLTERDQFVYASIVIETVTGEGEDFHCNTGVAARHGTEDDGIPWAYVVALPPEAGQWYKVEGETCMFAKGAYHPLDGGEPEEPPVAATPCEAPAFDVAGYHVYVGPEGIEVRDNGMLFEGPVRSLEQLTCLRDALFSDDESAMDRIEHLAGLLA